MELITEEKKGFKRTEVGLIPEDWKVSSIIELANVATGNTPKTNDRSNYGDEYLFVSPADLSTEAYIYNTEKKLSKKGFSKSRKFPKNSTLFTCIGSTIGKTGLASEELTSNQQINAVFPSENLHYLYSYYILTFRAPSIKELAGNQAVPIINKTQFQNTKIPLPPTLEEQQSIATALSDVDELIRSLDGLIQKKQAIKKGTMQQLLTGKKRLPGFDGEWEKISLKQLTDRSFELFNDGDWVESDHIIDQGIRLLQTGNVGVGKFKESRNKKYINEESFKKLNCKEVKVGDLLICRLADPPGRACIVPDLKEEKMITSVDVSILRPKVDEVDKHFLLQVFSTNEWFDEVTEKCGGTTRTRISRSALGNIELNLPPYEEQKAIGTIFKDMNQELQTIRQKREKYVQIKQGMMQELLTGKTRLI